MALQPTRLHLCDGVIGRAATILLGGLLLIWPAFANGYPLLFSDTGAFLVQLLGRYMVWDKPYIYGPVLAVVSLKLTLWLPALAQGALLSWVLWRVQAVFCRPFPWRHLVLCLFLSLTSAAPWFASLLMPDVLAPISVLALFLLAYSDSGRRWPLHIIASFAIASHLTHLVIAAACLAVVLLLRPRAVPRASVPLLVALALLLATNIIGHGRFGVSPFGSVFALARLVADGPAADYLTESCPESGYRLCAWVGRLPGKEDDFLWDPKGPVWTTPGGPIALAPEASRIVQATILTRPLAVAHAALGNMLTQIATVRLDEVIGAYWLDETVGFRLRAYYPVSEEARFQAGAQRHDKLRVIAAPMQTPHMYLLALGALGTLAVLILSWRRAPTLSALAALIGVGILANAFVTGALSGPHDRYGARIAWLLLLTPAIYVMARSTASGEERTIAS